MIHNIDDILQLPFFEYPTKRFIPKIQAIYFIFSGMELVYIGCTVNLKRRMYHHLVLKSDNENLRIHYTEYDLNMFRLNKLEKRLIRRFKPKLNKRLYMHNYLIREYKIIRYKNYGKY